MNQVSGETNGGEEEKGGRRKVKAGGNDIFSVGCTSVGKQTAVAKQRELWC